MAHPARLVANEFIQLGVDDRQPLTQLQILKLVYFAHGRTLVLLERPLIQEHFEAWPYGPVVPSLYNGLKWHGRDPIRTPLRTFRLPSFSDRELDIIHNTYTDYAHLSGEELMRLTHQRGTPWHKLRRFPGRPIIPEVLIYDWFKADLDGS